MKNNIKNKIIRFILYLVIIFSLFAITFSITFYVSYRMIYVPHDNTHLNGAKNLLKELPAIPNETAEPEINQMQNYTENPTDNPEYSLNP